MIRDNPRYFFNNCVLIDYSTRRCSPPRPLSWSSQLSITSSMSWRLLWYFSLAHLYAPWTNSGIFNTAYPKNNPRYPPALPLLQNKCHLRLWKPIVVYWYFARYVATAIVFSIWLTYQILMIKALNMSEFLIS